MHALKEADMLKHRTPRVNTMQKRDHTALWKGLLDYKFDAFWRINRRLMTPEEDEKEKEKVTFFRHIPFRLYLVKSSSSNAHPLYIQKLVSPLLQRPEVKASESQTEGEEDKPKPKSEHVEHNEATFGHLLSSVLRTPTEALPSKYRFVVHGIEPSLETPLQWMSEHFSYLDNFLHIALFEKT